MSIRTKVPVNKVQTKDVPKSVRYVQVEHKVRSMPLVLYDECDAVEARLKVDVSVMSLDWVGSDNVIGLG